MLAGDVGGISTSDQYSAEAFGLVGYRFGLFGESNANLLAGYRVLKQKYEDGDGRNEFEWDMTIHGPIVGPEDHVLNRGGQRDRSKRAGSPARLTTAARCLAFAALAGCAAYKAENRPLTEYPGIQGQIENFYDANAIEDDWACDSPQMQAIDRSEVVGQTASQVRMAIAYYFRSTALQAGQGAD